MIKARVAAIVVATGLLLALTATPASANVVGGTCSAGGSYTLSATGLYADLGPNLWRRLSCGRPACAANLLTGLRAEAGEAILEVRRLVDGLRPPSLDQVGLEQTLRQHARRVLKAGGRLIAAVVPQQWLVVGDTGDITGRR